MLKQSGEESQKSFYLIGMLYLIIMSVNFIGFLGLFYGIFDNFFIAIFCSFVMGFIISIIYLLALISLEPPVLPFVKEPGSIIFANIIRLTIVIAFALFVGKCMEMILIGLFESFSLIKYEGTDGYLSHMLFMNEKYPAIWFVTLLNILLFLAPIYIRKKLNKASEYYSVKRKYDRKMVEDNYSSFIKIRDELYRKMSYDLTLELPVNSLSISDVEITERSIKPLKHIEKYTNPPFNTKKKKKEKVYKSSKEFTHLTDWI